MATAWSATSRVAVRSRRRRAGRIRQARRVAATAAGSAGIGVAVPRAQPGRRRGAHARRARPRHGHEACGGLARRARPERAGDPRSHEKLGFETRARASRCRTLAPPCSRNTKSSPSRSSGRSRSSARDRRAREPGSAPTRRSRISAGVEGQSGRGAVLVRRTGEWISLHQGVALWRRRSPQAASRSFRATHQGGLDAGPRGTFSARELSPGRSPSPSSTSRARAPSTLDQIATSRPRHRRHALLLAATGSAPIRRRRAIASRRSPTATLGANLVAGGAVLRSRRRRPSRPRAGLHSTGEPSHLPRDAVRVVAAARRQRARRRDRAGAARARPRGHDPRAVQAHRGPARRPARARTAARTRT